MNINEQANFIWSMDSQRKDVFADNEGLRSGVGEQAFGLDMEKERRRIFRIQQRSSQ